MKYKNPLTLAWSAAHYDSKEQCDAQGIKHLPIKMISLSEDSKSRYAELARVHDAMLTYEVVESNTTSYEVAVIHKSYGYWIFCMHDRVHGSTRHKEFQVGDLSDGLKRAGKFFSWSERTK